MASAVSFACMVAVVLGSTSAKAADRASSEPSREEAPPEARPWHLRADVGTAAPASIDGRFTAELPGRLRAVGSVGVLPSAYARTVNGVLTSAKTYDSAVGNIVVGALSGSMVTRAHLGWRPFPRSGLYGDAGYSLVFLGGSVSSGQLVTALAGRIGTADPGSYSVSATLHMFDVEIGYEWTVADSLYVRTGLGGTFTVGRTVHVDPLHSPFPASYAQTISAEASARLEHLFAMYAHLPVVTVGVGYAFF